MTSKELLEGAKQLISDPERWTQKALARDGGGRSCLPWEQEAACWCVMGALQRAEHNHQAFGSATLNAMIALQSGAAAVNPAFGLFDFNDHADTKHGDVLAALDNAIARVTPK